MKTPSEKTVPIYARIPEADVAVIDLAASKQSIPISRSRMVAQIVREWVKQLSRKK